jgi:hypothetical protein
MRAFAHSPLDGRVDGIRPEGGRGGVCASGESGGELLFANRNIGRGPSPDFQRKQLQKRRFIRQQTAGRRH